MPLFGPIYFHLCDDNLIKLSLRILISTTMNTLKYFYVDAFTDNYIFSLFFFLKITFDKGLKLNYVKVNQCGLGELWHSAM